MLHWKQKVAAAAVLIATVLIVNGMALLALLPLAAIGVLLTGEQPVVEKTVENQIVVNASDKELCDAYTWGIVQALELSENQKRKLQYRNQFGPIQADLIGCRVSGRFTPLYIVENGKILDFETREAISE